jgi:hypothetical protein
MQYVYVVFCAYGHETNVMTSFDRIFSSEKDAKEFCDKQKPQEFYSWYFEKVEVE